MTKEEALRMVEEIRNIEDIDEVAHSYEDDLREAFIEFVAKRKDKLGEIARIVLSTNDIRFSRWCA